MAKIKVSSTELIWIFHQKAGSIRRDQPSRRSLIFLVGTTSDNVGGVVSQRPLQRFRLVPRRAHPHIAFFLHL